ncbi:MAG: septation protein IspZ [Betaproteobacteria bacterium]|nr:septation protein IspZ [Betaproteobacteria bacterium]
MSVIYYEIFYRPLTSSYIFYATFSAIIVSIFLAISTYLIKKKIEKMVLFNTLLITILGGLTILLKDNTFIMWKPTAIYWLFALVLIVSQFLFKKNLMKQMLGKQVNLQDHAWNHISTNVIIFLIGIGILNLYVAFNFDENTWVNFKLFGITFLLFIFMIYLALYISKENK